jgi:hypothetical protein
MNSLSRCSSSQSSLFNRGFNKFKKKSMAQSDEILPTGYWKGETAHIHHRFSPQLSRWLIDFLQPVKSKPIYDFGCGLGSYLRALSEAGFNNLTGFEGAPPYQSEFGNIQAQDLAEPFELPEKGCCVCLEVLEHIPKEFESIALHNITRSCESYLIISWAIPNQPGFGHVNCKDNDVVINEIESLDFRFLADETDRARSIITSSTYWFKNTLMIFGKT